MTENEMCVRLLLAATLGGAIGLEREHARRPAGLRTHLIVCVAAALLTASALLVGQQFEAPVDALRVVAGVVTGIGFIGAGTILQTKRAVHGLTTASTVFMAAAIGICVGSGFYVLAVTAAAITIFSTWILRLFEPHDVNEIAEADTEEAHSREIAKPAAPRKQSRG
jgi:putative Mg2+ transporter-C (MgtC) family protein